MSEWRAQLYCDGPTLCWKNGIERESSHLSTLTPRGGIVRHEWEYWMRLVKGSKKVRKKSLLGPLYPGKQEKKVVEVVNNKLIRNGSKIGMDERPDGQGSGKKKLITEQWAVSPIHYVWTDKLPAVRAGVALNKSKLTTLPWPYLKYSFPTSPTPACIKLHLLHTTSTAAHLSRASWAKDLLSGKYVAHNGLTGDGKFGPKKRWPVTLQESVDTSHIGGNIKKNKQLLSWNSWVVGIDLVLLPVTEPALVCSSLCWQDTWKQAAPERNSPWRIL